MTSPQDTELLKVRKVLDDWFRAFTEKNLEGIYEPIGPGFIMHLQDTTPIIGLEEYKRMIGQYLPSFGPLTHEEPVINISKSGDMAYAIGKHVHVILDKSGNTTLTDKHFIILKKVKGVWLVDGVSEMSY